MRRPTWLRLLSDRFLAGSISAGTEVLRACVERIAELVGMPDGKTEWPRNRPRREKRDTILNSYVGKAEDLMS